LASGPSIARLALEAGWRPSRQDLGRTGEAVTSDAGLGDPIASEVMRTAGRAVGIAIASALATLNVDIVVVGGGVARSGPLLFDPLREALNDYAHLAFAQDVPVVAAECGVNAGLIGAAGLIHRPDQYWGVME
jgi:glucokinase